MNEKNSASVEKNQMGSLPTTNIQDILRQSQGSRGEKDSVCDSRSFTALQQPREELESKGWKTLSVKLHTEFLRFTHQESSETLASQLKA